MRVIKYLAAALAVVLLAGCGGYQRDTQIYTLDFLTQKPILVPLRCYTAPGGADTSFLSDSTLAEVGQLLMQNEGVGVTATLWNEEYLDVEQDGLHGLIYELPPDDLDASDMMRGFRYRYHFTMYSLATAYGQEYFTVLWPQHLFVFNPDTLYGEDVPNPTAETTGSFDDFVQFYDDFLGREHFAVDEAKQLLTVDGKAVYSYDTGGFCPEWKYTIQYRQQGNKNTVAIDMVPPAGQNGTESGHSRSATGGVPAAAP